jgi:hypothetical protein
VPRTRTGWQFHILQNERTCQALESLQGSLWRAWAIMDLVSPRRVLLKKFARLEKPSVAGQWLTAPLATWNTEFGTLPLIGHERLDTDLHGRPRETTLCKKTPLLEGPPSYIITYAYRLPKQSRQAMTSSPRLTLGSRSLGWQGDGGSWHYVSADSHMFIKEE